MFTLNFPITVPEKHTFFDNGQYPVPPLPGDLSFHCISHDKCPIVLQISGFTTEEDAINFSAPLKVALRLAALDGDHSITPSTVMPVVSKTKIFNGSVPTVTPTKVGALPYHASESVQHGLHISVLSKLIGDSLLQGTSAKIVADPKLALSLELYSNCDFAGEQNAQFIVLMSALEVLVPSSTSKKRGAVIALVKKELGTSGHPDPKSVGKTLDALFVIRNALLHEAKPVSASDLKSLKDVVRSTLRALADR
jgi:hypothetical protein